MAIPNSESMGMDDPIGFYTSRGPSVVQLNKISEGTNTFGVFHCTIPVADGNKKNIYIGIYSSGEGRSKVLVCNYFF